MDLLIPLRVNIFSPHKTYRMLNPNPLTWQTEALLLYMLYVFVVKTYLGFVPQESMLFPYWS